MKTLDIPRWRQSLRLPLSGLLARAESESRSQWQDLPTGAGIYIVRWTIAGVPRFNPKSGKARHATPTDPRWLKKRWVKITKELNTDILYIGKAANLRKRVRQLGRFGVGKLKNHHGGEWIWQITKIRTAEMVILPCPDGKESGFENWCLERFVKDHDGLPLANRKGPVGPQRWCPFRRGERKVLTGGVARRRRTTRTIPRTSKR